jgi:alanyl-tRNA synthetase
MTPHDIRSAYLAYMQEREHAIIPSSSLVPENDPTTLFTGSGMQPMVPYLLGEKHPKGVRITNSQKCFRTEDIDEVGDNRHTTFFEMLGNWSFGDYFKEEQIEWMFEFMVNEVGLDPNKIYITVFGGDKENNLPADEDAPVVWKRLFEKKGIEAKVTNIGSEEEGYKRGMKAGERIFYYNAKKNWWSRAGVPSNMPAGEPGGPDSEMFYDFGTAHDVRFGEHCHPNCDCGRFVEIGNNVFMQYVKNEDGTFSELENKNIDFGGGLERIAAAAIDDGKGGDVFKIDLLWGLIEKIQGLSGFSYEEKSYAYRVIADHLRGAVFMIGDGVVPSNTDQGYFVRRLLRRAVRMGDVLGVGEAGLAGVVPVVTDMYKEQYPILHEKTAHIQEIVAGEEAKFRATLAKGLKEFAKIAQRSGGIVSGADAFVLFSTYGFPLELTQELAQEAGSTVDVAGFTQEMEQHQALSRKGAEQKFKGGLADSSEQTTMLHTATHLMLAGLRKFLGEHVHQAGSNITAERTRFDFTHPEKVPREVLDKVEVYVNEAISKGCTVAITQMNKDDAKAQGVEGSFWEKYPDVVNVYTVQDSEGNVYSRELCGGPHVEETAAIRGTFRIIKEEASSAGVRRVKAVLE